MTSDLEPGLIAALEALHDAHEDLVPLGIEGASLGMWHAIWTIQAAIASERCNEPPPATAADMLHRHKSLARGLRRQTFLAGATCGLCATIAASWLVQLLVSS